MDTKKLDKLTIWMDKRIKRALRVVCSYRNVSLTNVFKYLAAYYILNDGVLPKFDMNKATEKIIKYNRVAELKIKDELEGGLDEKEQEFADEEER